MAADHDYRTGRLRQKYVVTKADGSPVDPEAQYFVLRVDADPNAQIALMAYAEAVDEENFEFASDLRDWAYRVMPDAMKTEAGRTVMRKGIKVLASWNPEARGKREGLMEIAEKLRDAASEIELCAGRLPSAD